MSTAASASASAIRYEVEFVRDVRIPTADPGTTLSADVYLPSAAAPAPALVLLHPYRNDTATGVFAAANAGWFAERGYASVWVDLRGTGSSDGPMRAALTSDDGDDGVAVVEWAAQQPWCSGNVGMWGLSYSAWTAIMTASRRPSALKAIMPIMGPVDRERDVVHPYGIRGGNFAIPFWCTHQLANQLLPPLHDRHDAEQRRRWYERLHDSEPVMSAFFRQGPGDPAWRERVIDTSAIEAATLCVAGWWDLFRDSQIHAYEQIRAPKKLLVGPWLHVMPHVSPNEPIDFFPLALRWWDHWLRGADDGFMDEAPVTLYTQGAGARWRAYESWPPVDGELSLATDLDTTLATPSPTSSQRAAVIAEYQPDPTIGALSGVWAIHQPIHGLPLDQHDDDMRAVSATSEPLPSDVLIVGRPTVNVTLNPHTSAQRLMVRLCDVDPEGRSTLITSGAAMREQQVVLDPTAYRIEAGHRVRVAISDAEFPRWWPLRDASSLAITAIELVAPTVSESTGAPTDMAALEQPNSDVAALSLWEKPVWRITRDPVHEGIEVVSGLTFGFITGQDRHERRRETTASVRRDSPEAALIKGTDTQTVRLGTGETIEVAVNSRLTTAALWVHGEVAIDGVTIFSRIWDLAPDREL